MRKNKYLDIVIQNSLEEEEKKESQSTTPGNFILKKLFKKIATVLTIKLFIITIFILIIFLPIFLILGMLIGLSGGDQLSDNSGNYYIDGDSFVGNFSKENLDTPLGIPVERGIISYGYDYKRNKNSLIVSFLKLVYSNSKEYYEGHRGLDFARTYQDKQDGYNPYIISTLRGVIKQIESREEKSGILYYKRRTYSGGNTLEYSSSIKKSQEQKSKPYGNHVIISSLTGEYYVMFAHLSSLNKEVLKTDKIGRGNILGRMGTTGNSTGVHLHYEIRFCGNNPNLTKQWSQCSSMNPLGTVIGEENTFLGFPKLPSVNKFIAGNFESIKENIEDEDQFIEKINEEYNDYCKSSEIIFFGREITCKEVFPILYINEKSGLYPQIIDEVVVINIGKKYIEEEYNIKNTPTLEQINEIKKIEGIKKSIFTSEELYKNVGKKFSLGKYGNLHKYYKSYIDNKEDIMFSDLLDVLDDIKKENKDIESIYNEYYKYNIYSPGKNPYIYNMSSSENIFMDVLDGNGDFISKYNSYGVLTIYKKLK